MVPEFNADLVWKLLASADNDINVFMAVPTIYAKLVEAFPKTFSAEQWGERARNELRSKIRLMVSGSAALPEVCVTVTELVWHGKLPLPSSIVAGIEVLAIAHRPLPAGTVRNERDRHGPLQPLGGVRQEGGLRRISVSRRGGQNSFLR